MNHSFRVHLAQAGCRTYAEYLASAWWRGVREAYRRSGRPQCCLACGDPKYQLHHRTYTRLGCELLNDLVPLCGACHRRVHEVERADGTPIQATHAILRRVFGWSKAETRRRFEPFSEGGAGPFHWVPPERRKRGQSDLLIAAS